LPKWEYESVTLIQEQKITGLRGDVAVLNKYGSEGWELVSVIPIQNNRGFIDAIAFFKRQLS
jgi:hypothetical protein